MSSQRSWPKPHWPLVCLVTKGYHESEPPKIARNVLSQSSQPSPTDSQAKIALPLLKSYPGEALSFCVSDRQSSSQQACFHNTTSPAKFWPFPNTHRDNIEKGGDRDVHDKEDTGLWGFVWHLAFRWSSGFFSKYTWSQYGTESVKKSLFSHRLLRDPPLCLFKWNIKKLFLLQRICLHLLPFHFLFIPLLHFFPKNAFWLVFLRKPPTAARLKIITRKLQLKGTFNIQQDMLTFWARSVCWVQDV